MSTTGTYMLREVYADETVTLRGPFETIEGARAEADARQEEYAERLGQVESLNTVYGLGLHSFPVLERTDVLRARFEAVEVRWAGQ